MIIVMSRLASDRDLQAVVDRVREIGLRPEISRGEDRAVVGVIGANAYAHREAFSHLSAVQEIVQITKPFKLGSREFQPQDTVVDVAGVPIGGEEVVVMAGPCSVEGQEMLLETARFVAAHGARILRGGAFKPRTSPYSFQGLGEVGLRMLAAARDETGLRVVSEVMTPSDVEMVAGYVDMLQVGTRNMQNYALLQEVGRTGKPVLLKRGMSSTVEEWLLAAEYVLSQGNRNVVLCERGIRTFEQSTRFTLDLNVVPLVRELSHLPVVVDPSQGTGRWSLVRPMSLAAVAAGARGLLLEVHPRPEKALSDGAQSLDFENFERLTDELARLEEAIAGQPA
ncbi:MAG: 3-deoxy-7-phosphoheptulonate synthase [Candidatus Nephthysia bennettiae]|uniref:3-deoxy-7-phosphoheptulonate synthase n=1 Tax=Candidatus Nephthysia bennettiae TaxID=3127016 RepID=A0A934N8E6_9BACT|nr:3-deoxy-7-phosphoheptulonate synthase [Candidatus Dormibacteraeota bacterium]MBJ7611710.1 3-deoxy-7-phosphoheptulonate synthase [Candidatus Dormibacteraeota bacterium]PZR96708.1 MAG: 3-deoxy-7-phosphoheptulonate synthase [Candidatus Dormibacteraeota bacterium]